MPTTINRLVLSTLLSFLFVFNATANDSDQVNCNHAWKIAILGSSTAYGTGASTYDSSWVGRFTTYVVRKNSHNVVYNFGIPGYTTYQNLCPTGFTPPANRPSPNSSFNITAVLNLHPDALIINMPSNDAANDYTLAEQQANFERAIHLADSANVPVWITTTQPRNNMSAAQMNSLVAMRDWINNRFADKAVDFWTGAANADGTINNYYDYDYVHVNNHGHELFYSRIKAETILDSLCARITQTLVARAGSDQSITLPQNTASLDGSASYSTLGGIVTGYQWQYISGPAGSQIVSASNAITAVNGLTEGRYAFLLTVTDNAANIKSDTINILVSSRILIDFGPDITISPDANGNYWNTVTETQPGIKLSNALTTGNEPTNIGLQVINRIDGTFNIAGPGTNTGNSATAVNDYPATAITDFSFAEASATNGQWVITGLESTKQYTVKFWGTRSVADDRIIQIKRGDQTIWQEYNATGNNNYNNAAIFTFSGKTSITFDIRVKSGSAFGYICLIDITRTTPAITLNVPPFARANDITIPLPATSGTLDGSASGDDDGSITNYQWIQTSGPAPATIASPNSAITAIDDLIEGIYTFRLTVTDDSSAMAFTDVIVNVNARVLIDFGTNPTIGADATGKYWNNVADGLEGSKIQNAVNTGNVPTSLGLEIINRIDGTFNTAGPGTNTGSISSDVNDYPNSAVADYAFAHTSATNGQWKLTGLDPLKQYTIKFWGTRDAADERIIQIKPADETNWQEYDARNNTDYNNAAVFTFTGKTERVFDIRVKENNTFSHISLIDIKITNPPVDCSPTIIISSDQSAAACYGTAISFTATATNTGSTPVYVWKKNGEIISGASGSTYTATDLNNNDSISCSINASTNCFYGTSAVSNSIAAQVLPLVELGVISGPTDVCPLIGNTAVYSVNQVSGVTIYNWTVPAGVNIISGQGTISITVSITSNINNSAIISVTGGNCGNAIPSNLLLVTNIPAIPGPITGPASACPYLGNNVQATYSIAAVPYATSYTWTIPANVNIISGQGTNSIVVVFGSGFTTSPIAVSAVSNCFTTKNNAITVGAAVTNTPGSITGPTEACPYVGTTAIATYTIRKVTGATSYIWSVPAGATISTHPAGTGVNDTIVTISYNSNFVSGTLISVQASGCTVSSAATLAVLKTAPATPGVISGPVESCPYIGTTNQTTYTVRKVAGATSYIWTVPTGIAVSSHPGGTSVNDTIIKVVFSSSFISGTAITVKAVSCLTSNASSLTILKTAPATPGIISGPTNVCAAIGSTSTYTIRKVTGATSYIWAVPAGVTLSSHPGGTGVNDTIIRAIITANVTSGSVITVQASSCAASAASILTLLKTAPAVPVAISGPAEACAYIGTTTTATYTTRKVPGATSYSWTVPAGVTVSSPPAGTGINDTIIKVTFNNNFVNGSTISVQAVNCVASAARTFAIARPVPAVPGAIKVVVVPCVYSALYGPVGGFSVQKIAGLTYTWSAPLGSTIYHYGSATGTSDTIGVVFPLLSTGGTVSVKASNGCGTSAATSVTVGVINQATVSLALTGPTDPCPYMGTATGAVYKVKKVAGIATYTWTTPSSGVTVTHPNGAGENDTVIVVTFSASFSSGSISVTANTLCGSSPAKTITLAKGQPAVPGTITATSIAACPNRRYTYSVSSLPVNATTVFWTVPSGATIVSGQNTTTITVSYPSTAISGTVAAYGRNNCGTSNGKTLSVSLAKCNTANRGTNSDIPVSEVLKQNAGITVMPNPSYGDFTLEIRGNDPQATGILHIYDISGKMIETKTAIQPGKTLKLGGGYKPGIYIGEYIQGTEKIMVKLIKM